MDKKSYRNERYLMKNIEDNREYSLMVNIRKI